VLSPKRKVVSSSLAGGAKKDRVPDKGHDLFSTHKRLEQLNATRMSVAGEGLTEPNLYFPITEMQTCLAGGAKKDRVPNKGRYLFCT